MKTILDQTSDLNGQMTHRLTTLFSPPEFVKNASSEKAYGTNEILPLRCYCDPQNRLYPAHTKEATWLSALFFFNNVIDDTYSEKRASAIEERLNSFAEYFNITKEIVELKTKVKQAAQDPTRKLDNSDFALIIEYADGKTERYYPLRNPDEVKTAASYLDKFKNVLPLSDRQKMAQKILEKSGHIGVTFDDETAHFLEKQAGYGVCAAEDAAKLLLSRASLLAQQQKDIETREELRKMASICVENAEFVRSSSSLTKLACIVDEIDRKFGFHNHYDSEIDRPEDVLFSITIKAAEHVLSDHCSIITGNIYKIADFRKLDLESVRDVMGESFADEISVGGLSTDPEKLAEIAETLPRPDAELLDRLLSKSGISPIAKEAAHDSKSLTAQQLHDLAYLR